MGTEDTGSERALGHLTTQLLAGVAAPRVLVGGLGMGYTLRALLDGLRANSRLVVAELLPAVVRWNRGRLGHLSNHALRDPRVRLHVGDVANLLNRRAWDAILLDIDNGPEWMVQKSNQRLYGRAGLSRLLSALRPGGFIALWSIQRNPDFERRLASMGLRVRRFRRVSRDGDPYQPLVYVVQA